MAAPAASAAVHPTPEEDCILVLQGGGALGAYQAGVYEQLATAGKGPRWVAGISIGAINAALIAGNPPERRVARLREFWELVTSWDFGTGRVWADLDRGLHNRGSAALTLLFGARGFFVPRFPPAALLPPGPAATSYYDTAPLRETLERLIDFDRLNDGGVRLSVGAVNVRTGNFAYFDTAQERLDVRHVMASGALPPGFAPVQIGDEHYWDGGLVSNTPLQHVLDQPGIAPRVVFQVDLFPARGPLPTTLAEVDEREKDIRYSSRTRMNTTLQLQHQAIAQAARRLLEKLPPALRADPDAQALAGLRAPPEIAVVHLIYRGKHHEQHSKDYEFSRVSMHERWQAGRSDTARTLADPRWTGRERHPTGVHVYDLTTTRPTARTERVESDPLREQRERRPTLPAGS